jgi:fructokinase
MTVGHDGAAPPRIGMDLGGTKIEGLVLDGANRVVAGPHRVATPRQDYAATIGAVRDLVRQLDGEIASELAPATIGVGIPGSIVKRTGLVQNANSVWLNGKPFGDDLTRAIGRPVRLANDANCFALSEASDGAAAGARSVFGVILGTGCGGGLVFEGRLVDGPNGIGGEWGHNPLPWPTGDEIPGPECWCGRHGCMETWVAGPSLERTYAESAGEQLAVSDIARRAERGDAVARAVMAVHLDRLARGLAHVVNVFDPEVIVLGGGLSNLSHLYDALPGAVARHVFSDDPKVDVRPPKWGDSSGVRGAAWLWQDSRDLKTGDAATQQ